MRLNSMKMVIPMILMCGLLVGGCSTTVRNQAIFPPSADVVGENSVTASKPRPSDDIVTDEDARAAHNVALEVWGETVRKAGVRLCKWHNDNGASFDCPE